MKKQRFSAVHFDNRKRLAVEVTRFVSSPEGKTALYYAIALARETRLELREAQKVTNWQELYEPMTI